MIVSFMIVVLIAVACGVGPGYLLVRRARWEPGLTFAASVGASLAITYLLCFWAFAATHGPAYYGVVLAACTVVTLAQALPLVRLLRHPRVWPVAVAFVAVWAWTMTATATVRNFSGGGHILDWVEHWRRTQYFLGRFPDDFLFIGTYTLPARPPMMNVLSAFVLARTGERFEAYQLVTALLNCLPMLPGALLLRRFAPRRWRLLLPVLAGVLAINPFFVENVLYPWTKLLTVFYVLLALELHLRATRGPTANALYVLAAWAALGAGMAVHYSAGPFAVAMGVHLLWRLARGGSAAAALRAIAAAVIGVGATLGPWVAWSVRTFGTAATLGANTTVAGTAQQSAWSNVLKVAANVVSTVLPADLTVSAAGFELTLGRPRPVALVRDHFFFAYQETAIVAMGAVGGLAVLWLLWRDVIRDRRSPRARFWRWFVGTSFVLGIAAHGERNGFGVAHVTLQPLVILGLVYLAARAPSLPRAARWLLYAGWVVDLAAGVALNLYVQSAPPADAGLDARGRFVVDGGADAQGTRMIANYHDKLMNGFTFLGDHVPARAVVWIVAVLGAGIIVATARRIERVATAENPPRA